MRLLLALLPLPSRVLLALSLVLPALFSQAEAQSLSITRAEWRNSELRVEGRAAVGQQVTVRNAADGWVIGSTTVGKAGRWFLRTNVFPVPCGVRAESAGQIVDAAVKNAPATCGGSGGASLTSLTISGPSSVPENGSANYTATASFSDGSSKNVTAQATWSEDSGYASIAAGTLSTQDVPADQNVIISAAYTEGATTKTAQLAVAIVIGTVSSGGSHYGRFTTFEGTRTCLSCHPNEALEVHSSVHYQWQGDTSYMVNATGPLAGKLGGINDFCIYPDINWIGVLKTINGSDTSGGCAQCHAGLGLKPAPEVTQTQLENIDCLICHSPSYKRKVANVDGTFRFVPDTATMGVSILEAAWDITRPSTGTCLNCHSKSGGGNNYKRGDIEEAHRNAARDFDVHLSPKSAGGAGLSCLSCHKATNHRIAGRGSDLREIDSPDPVRCTNCHLTAPHGNARLDQHAKRVACATCHIPEFAKVAATDMRRDWSLPGEVDAAKGLYDPHMLKASHVVPEYRFFNGTSYFYNFGDTALPQSNGRVLMSGPAGDVNDPAAKIFPFKRHEGNQPIDPDTDRLLPLKIGIFFQTGDLASAVQAGAAGVGWPYNGHQFAETERFLGIFHEVAPKEQALGCSTCHDGNRLDFALLGYTPKSTRDGKPLCASCHQDKSGAWSPSELFTKVHAKHVTDKKLDCSNCHGFSAAQ